ncbi:putative response regulator receiver domain protein [Nautilia profundicola AmH]|uniref:Response regulator receiver domain protein n=1 Tax=Nautilia profundicola (strain ATCC BAA-1463 / DSM 18972 / AmH) TaxID=598659 RepID=B9L8A4_NAUPA|nr:response regulator [Nautilia profundicola]ACM93101.1 putative response regulator receiver domain protein [Nautilia profundicola AmH]
MKIAILDDSKTFLSYIGKMLKKLDLDEIYTFTKSKDFYDFISENTNIDAVFIDYHLEETDGFDVLENIKQTLPNTYKIMITSDSSLELKEKALNLGFDTFLEKNIAFADLQALINMIKTLRKYIKKEIEKKEAFKKILSYKEYQEKIIHQKQNKIMKNELEMFFDENFLFETYFKPKDLLTGDTVYTKKISKNEYFIGLIDAMGKGLGASLTSFNALSFLKHSINKAVEYNDFNFEKLNKDFINYVKTILLENEILSATLVYIQNGKMHYANFGNPPILTSSAILGANNYPIRYSTEDIQIDTVKMENKILISSDGIFESPYDETIYFKRLKEIFPKITFLKEIMEDFYAKSKQIDDTCLVFITKENKNFQTIFEDKLLLQKEQIDNFLQKLYIQNIPNIEQIHLILHEILTNTYEHAVLEVGNKENINETNDFSKKFDEKRKIFAKIKLSKNEKWLKIEYQDDSEGFDVQKIKDAYYKKYHGRGIKIIKHLSYGLFFNEKGTSIKIFLKA